MTAKYGEHVGTRITPQSEAILGREQVKNSAGGYVFAVDDWVQLDRFLILGAEGGTYYATERKLTQDGAASAIRCLKTDGQRYVDRVVEISQSGRAPKNDPAVFLLALAAGLGSPETQKAALLRMPDVARTGTWLFQFYETVRGLRGNGPALRKAIGRWYSGRDASSMAYQIIKYRQRNGWTHRDVLRLARPMFTDPAHQAVARWVVAEDKFLCERVIVRGPKDKNVTKTYPASSLDDLPTIVLAFSLLQEAKTADEAVEIINGQPTEDFPKITWEMVPSQFLGERNVWAALLPNMPMTALVRNMARMTANGLIAPMSDSAGRIKARLSDADEIKKSRLHPVAILGALMTYMQGHGEKGNLTWLPNQDVVDALHGAFYMAFVNVVPSGKRTLLAVDVSGSMGGGLIAGMAGLTPRIAAAAMALVTKAVEPKCHVMGFSDTFIELPISADMRLDAVVRVMSGLPFSGTDCSLPMRWANVTDTAVDTFVVYTDSETWAGNIHPNQALAAYRKKTGIKAKLVVVGMTATEFTIADPADSGMLDVVGFDTSTPDLISQFSAD